MMNADTDMLYYVGINKVDPYIANFNIFPIAISYFPAWDEKNMSKDQYVDYLKTKPYISLYPLSTNIELQAASNKNKGKVYLYIYTFDEEFKEKYGFLFENGIEEDTTYLMYIKNGTVQFIEQAI